MSELTEAEREQVREVVNLSNSTELLGNVERVVERILSSRLYQIEWAEAGPEFGAAHPHGCCNTRVRNTVCGWPRRADGSCTNGHPAQPTSGVTS